MPRGAPRTRGAGGAAAWALGGALVVGGAFLAATLAKDKPGHGGGAPAEGGAPRSGGDAPRGEGSGGGRGGGAPRAADVAAAGAAPRAAADAGSSAPSTPGGRGGDAEHGSDVAGWVAWLSDGATAAVSSAVSTLGEHVSSVLTPERATDTAGRGGAGGASSRRTSATRGSGSAADDEGETLLPEQPEFHRLLWLQASDASVPESLDELRARYAEAREKAPPEEVAGAIDRDVHRTFPKQPMFAAGSTGRDALRRVLRAYAVLDGEVAYVQGMNFLAGMLLLHCNHDRAGPNDEADAFVLLWRLLHGRRFGLRSLFLPGLPGVKVANRQVEILMEARLPDVAAHLRRVGFSFNFVMEWYFTLFTYALPVPVAAKLWDQIFESGWTAVLRCVLVLFELAAPALLQPEGAGSDDDDADLPTTIHLLKSFRYSSGNGTEGERGGDMYAEAGALTIAADLIGRVRRMGVTHREANAALRAAQAEVEAEEAAGGTKKDWERGLSRT